MGYVVIFLVILFAFILPGTLVMIRETVKYRRQEVIRDLAAVFHVKDGSAEQRLIPSFEFVKFKYFIPTHEADQDRRPQDFETSDWLIAILPFTIIVGLLSWLSFTVLLPGGLPVGLHPLLGLEACPDPAAAECTSIPVWTYAAISAFFGSYIVEIRGLYRAINNFDLSPALIIDCAIDIATGTVIAILIATVYEILDFSTPVKNLGLSTPFENIRKVDSAVILFCFAAGYLPQATVRWILTKSRLKNFKRENQDIYKLFEATPIELVDGIDTEIRDRLADFHISSTQNLAAANPLMLFVETPYGVYQIMDWVAQAQLCASVGPKSVASLWRLGVRTLFDLERAALDPLCRNTRMLEAIGAAMFLNSPLQPVSPAYGSANLPYDEAFIRANIEMRLDDPHVHRLRQIYMQVGERIGREHFRFLSKKGVGFRPASVKSSTIRFIKPDTIEVAEGGLGMFMVGDAFSILGGVNDGKSGTVTVVSDSELKSPDANLDDAHYESHVVLSRINA